MDNLNAPGAQPAEAVTSSSIPLDPRVTGEDDEDEWEYEYSTTETEVGRNATAPPLVPQC